MIARNRRPELVRKLAVPALLLAVAASGTKAQSGDPSPAVQKETKAAKKTGSRQRGKRANPLLKEARRALVAAGKLGRAPKGSKHGEKLRRLSEAAMAYRSIAAKYAALPEVVAEAVFRQGQLLGRMGRGDESVKLFRRVASGPASRFAVRALLEAGHVERRRKHYPDALALYRECGQGKDRKYADRGRAWTGQTLARLGRIPDARKVWETLANDSAADPFLRIRAFDSLAKSYLDEKLLARARSVLKDADDQLAAQASGSGKRAQQLRRSLDRMRTRKRLARAAKDSSPGGRR